MSEVNTAFPVKCEHTRLVEIGQLVPHPQNCKNHDKDAVERQAAVMEYQGWRRPITVSNLSGRVTSGHKRLLAAKLKKATHVPVSFQDYDNEGQEIADLIADNALNEWEPTSRTAVNIVVPHLGPDFDINMLGLKDFTLDIVEKDARNVWDGYLGSGSTLIACEKTNRRCFGMEIDPHYGRLIIERWQKFSGKKAHREDGVLFEELKPTTD